VREARDNDAAYVEPSDMLAELCEDNGALATERATTERMRESPRRAPRAG